MLKWDYIIFDINTEIKQIILIFFVFCYRHKDKTCNKQKAWTHISLPLFIIDLNKK